MNLAQFHSTLFGILLALAAMGFGNAGLCLEPKKAEQALKPPEPKNLALPSSIDSKSPMTDIQRFCSNNAATAGDARAAWQAAKLIELEEQVKQRIAELEAKRAEYEQWLKKREEVMLVRGGLDEKRIERIEGYADHRLKIANNPLAAENRRIEILVRKDKP